jgi:collagenase-like PrtC family protease
MKLSVATNWDIRLLDNLEEFSRVHSVYGKMERDLLGGGRPSYLLPEVDEQQVEDYVRQSQQRGIRFIYLLNSQCLDNLEYTAEFQRQMIAQIGWLDDIGVDYVTVSIPFLLQMIKRQFPRLKVYVSVFANINSVQRARFFEGLGADVLSLPEYVNRDFTLLRQIKQAVQCEVQLIANMTCLYGCPFQLYHANLVSHASQADHASRGFCPDYCILNCTRRKIAHPQELIKSRWIRPEDTHHYEEIGIDSFKIIERFDTTEVLTHTVRAYHEEKYDGNLADILNIKTRPQRQLPPRVHYFLQPDFADVSRLQDMEETLYLADQYIDNRGLDGFTDFFRSKDCYRASCEACGYCKKIADRVVRIDPQQAALVLARIDQKIDDLVSGDFFRAVQPKPAPGNIGWDPAVEQTFRQMIQAVPPAFQQVSEKAVSLKAESLARQRDSRLVEAQDMVQAFLTETPQAFQPQMRQDLQRLVTNVEKYLD